MGKAGEANISDFSCSTGGWKSDRAPSLEAEVHVDMKMSQAVHASAQALVPVSTQARISVVLLCLSPLGEEGHFLLAPNLSPFSCHSWHSQGRNTEVVCHSFLSPS